MMKSHFIIVCGGNIKDEFCEEKRILNLSCNDNYEGLPEKVIKTFSYIVSHKYFDIYTQFIKLDDDISVIKKIDLFEYDYFGIKCYKNAINRLAHTEHQTNTFWDYTAYNGEICDLCLGGYGYGISRKALNKIVPNFEYTTHIYEDLYIALLLKRNDILPQHVNMTDYFISPEHGYLSGLIIKR